MKKKIIYLLLLMLLMPLCLMAQSKSTFEIKDGHFYRNGKVTQPPGSQTRHRTRA